MTTSPRARRRATLVSFGASLVVLAAAGVLGLAGLRTLANSTTGQRAAGSEEVAAVQRLPYTSTALVGVLDATGRLTSVVSMVLGPDATGGTIIGFAATADARSGVDEQLRPIGAVLAAEGPESFLAAVGDLSLLSYDVVELVDLDRLRDLLAPIGDVDVDLPVAVNDATTGEEWPAGDQTLTSAAAARVLAASDPSVPDWSFEPARAAVWAGVADAVGAGITPSTPLSSPEGVEIVPATLDEFFTRLVSGSVAARSLPFVPVDPERVAAQLAPELSGVYATGVADADQAGGDPGDAVSDDDTVADDTAADDGSGASGGDAGSGAGTDAVVLHDPGEVVLVVGSVAPGRVGAPLDAPAFRVVSGFDDADAATEGMTASGVAKEAIDLLLFVQVNVVSVSLVPDEEVPAVTRIEVADPGVVAAVQATYRPIFGEIEVVVGDVLVDGVDIKVTLGRTFLPIAGAAHDADVASSGGDAVADTTSTEPAATDEG